MNGYQELLPLIIFYIVFMSVMLILALAGYLFKGFGMYGIAKKMNISAPWLAFIPIASNYLQGRLAGEFITVGNKEFKNPALWTLFVPIIYYAVFYIVYFIFLFAVVLQSINGLIEESPAVVLNLISSLIVFFVVILIFAIVGDTLVNLIFGLVRFNIHKKYQDDNTALLHMLLGMFIPLYQSVYFFVLRNKMPLYEQQLQMKSE